MSSKCINIISQEYSNVRKREKCMVLQIIIITMYPESLKDFQIKTIICKEHNEAMLTR